MAKKDNLTTWQKLTNVIIGAGSPGNSQIGGGNVTYNVLPKDQVLYRYNTKEERDVALAQMKQQKLAAYQWKKSGYETSMEQLAGATQVKVMYRDADLMDGWPEISKALDIFSEEATTLKNGKMLNIYSKSPRIKAILEDLFVNRLTCHVILPEIIRGTCKYGNDFRLLNVSDTDGIIGWREMPVHQMRRIEDGLQNIYGGASINTNLYNLKPEETKFVWEGHNEQIPFRSWQIAHFRLIRNSLFLPYGVSVMNSARRHWRMLSMMEDGMLLYRLEKSVERRIFKVNVGAIDEQDVQGFLQEFANSFKRAPIVDPLTGQLDLRKNFLDVSADYFIPVRSGQDPTSIDTLNSAQNQTSMDDINYMENKMLTAMGVPKAFLNFQDSQGKQQNLSLQDIRFCRAVNYIQQAVLMELNKIAIIHLYLLGFTEDLNNFTISLNNPSNQIEVMELDNLTKRIQAATSALAEQGGGIPLMSWHQVQKEIMGKSDAEISVMLNEMRLETAISTELQLTSQIIKKTGLFDKVDRLYGEPNAKYDFGAIEGGGGAGGLGGGGGAMPMGGDFGGDLGDLGEPGSDMGGDIGGEEGIMDLSSMGNEGGETQTPNENIFRMDGRSILTEHYKTLNNLLNEYNYNILNSEGEIEYLPKSTSDKMFMNEELNESLKQLDKLEKEFDKNKNLLD